VAAAAAGLLALADLAAVAAAAAGLLALADLIPLARVREAGAADLLAPVVSDEVTAAAAAVLHLGRIDDVILVADPKFKDLLGARLDEEERVGFEAVGFLMPLTSSESKGTRKSPLFLTSASSGLEEGLGLEAKGVIMGDSDVVASEDVESDFTAFLLSVLVLVTSLLDDVIVLGLSYVSF